jgi:hypothetical protein
MAAADGREKHRRPGLSAAELIIRFLASPAGTFSATLMGRIPGLWSKVFLRPVMPKLLPADVETLKSLVTSCPDTARILFSMALRYIDEGDPISDARALACLRTAEFLQFEACERITLWRAVLAARSGAVEEAATLGKSLQPHEISDGERARLESALASSGQAAGPVNQQPATSKTPETVLVLDDHDAKSARWFPASRYLWVSTAGNRLSLSWAAGVQTSFDAVCGPLQLRKEAEAAGIRYAEWIETT